METKIIKPENIFTMIIYNKSNIIGTSKVIANSKEEAEKYVKENIHFVIVDKKEK